MADKKDQFIYSEEIKKLRSGSVARLYLLYGQEEYLKEVFADEIRKTLFPDGDDGFSYKRFSDSDFSVADIEEAVDAVPFLSECTLVEVRDFDINRYGEQLLPVVSDIPEYCTVLFVQNSEYVPDFRLKLTKLLRDNYKVFNISVPGQNELTLWIRKRFSAEGKNIGREAAEQLVFLSGNSMNGLIPEIKKISSSVVSDTVTADDVKRFAHHLPEADVFEMVECLSQGRKAKAVNFGIIYGISSFGLGEDLGISRKEAKDYIEKYFLTYPKIKNYLDDSVKNAKELGYVKTMMNRIRPIPELSSSNFMQRSFGERVAMNSPIQGTAADIIKLAMINVRRELKERGLKSRLILQIHDELLIEAENSEIDVVTEILTRNMENAVKLSVPLYVDVHTGDSLYEAK